MASKLLTFFCLAGIATVSWSYEHSEDAFRAAFKLRLLGETPFGAEGRQVIHQHPVSNSKGHVQLSASRARPGTTRVADVAINRYLIEMLLSNPDSINNYLLIGSDPRTFGVHGGNNLYEYPHPDPVNAYINLSVDA